MNDNVIKINPNDILHFFSVEGENYCSLRDNDKNDIYFALISRIDSDNYVLTSVPESKIDIVVDAYQSFLNTIDLTSDIDDREDI